MKKKNKKTFTLKNKFIVLRPYRQELVNNSYLNMFKNNEIKKFLEIKKVYELKDAKNYFKNFLSVKKNYFWFIFKAKKNIGTISLKFEQNKYLIGYMIGYKKYFGKKESIIPQSIVIDFAFKYLKVKELFATCHAKNLSSGFSLIKNGFKLYFKKKKIFYFILKKKDWCIKINYRLDHE